MRRRYDLRFPALNAGYLLYKSPRRTWPRIRRHGDTTALARPADGDAFFALHRGERIGAQAVVADRIEVVTERQHRGDAVEIPGAGGAGLIWRAVGGAKHLALRHNAPSFVGYGVAFMHRGALR